MRHSIAKPAAITFVLCFTSIWATPQSLEEAARRETERRRALDRQGTVGKVILEDQARHTGDGGNLTISTPGYALHPEATGTRESKGKGSAKSYLSAIKKLDHEIGQAEERVAELSSRLRAARWAMPKSGKPTSKSTDDSSQERMRDQIQKLELQLKRWRQERLDTYREGRKAGFLPGELEGRGIDP